MTRLLIRVLMAAAVVVGVSPALQAHTQKFMGTVASIDGPHVTITTTDEKSIMVMLHAKTKILRGKEAKKASDITTGERIVVVTSDGKDKAGKSMLMANEIRLGTGQTKK